MRDYARGFFFLQSLRVENVSITIDGVIDKEAGFEFELGSSLEPNSVVNAAPNDWRTWCLLLPW